MAGVEGILNDLKDPQAAKERMRAEFEAKAKANGQAGEQPGEQAHEPIKCIDWAALEGREPPKREFLVEGWIPLGCAVSLYAPGGTGKSMLAQQLGSCVAAGKPFLGMQTLGAPVLGSFCEDDDNELWRRQCRINSSYSLCMGDIAAFNAQGRLGMSNLLATFPKGKPPVFLPLFFEIEEVARRIAAKLIILDNAAQLFGGEENARSEVTTFINGLNGMARRLNASVLMLGHPPKNGADYSGNTAWHSVVRGLMTLGSLMKDGDEDAPPGSDDETFALKLNKANYAKRGEEVHLRWVDGVLRRYDGEGPRSGMDAAFRQRNAMAVFLTALDTLNAQRRNVSHSTQAKNYAPKAMTAAGLAQGLTKAELAQAMNALFGEGVIIANAELWRGSDRKPVLGIARVSAGQ